MKDKIVKKRKSGTVTIDPSIIDEANKICKANGLLLKFFVEEAIKEKMQRLKSK